MSTKPYDFLSHDKEPFIYFEKSIIKQKDGYLIAYSGHDGVFPVSPSSHLVMLLGPGTSITQEAACHAAKSGMNIAFVRGGNNVHSFFMDGRYQDPVGITNQVLLTQNKKLEIAKMLLHFRFKRNKIIFDEEYLKSLTDLQSVIAFEGREAKKTYAKFCQFYKTQNFKRDFDSNDEVNAKLNILNNSLYSITTAFILSCGLHPSIGFLHGSSRRGGLAFDLADILKIESTMDIAFDKRFKANGSCMYELSRRLKDNNFEKIKLLIQFCLYFAGGKDITIKEFSDVSCYS